MWLQMHFYSARYVAEHFTGFTFSPIAFSHSNDDRRIDSYRLRSHPTSGPLIMKTVFIFMQWCCTSRLPRRERAIDGIGSTKCHFETVSERPECHGGSDNNHLENEDEWESSMIRMEKLFQQIPKIWFEGSTECDHEIQCCCVASLFSKVLNLFHGKRKTYDKMGDERSVRCDDHQEPKFCKFFFKRCHYSEYLYCTMLNPSVYFVLSLVAISLDFT